MYERKKFPTHILVFLTPAVIIYSLFMVIPLLNSLRLSFYSVTPDNQEVFAGFANYVRLLTDNNFAPRFWGALQNNGYFFLMHMLIQNSVALLLATLISNEKRHLANFYRTAFFMPTVLSVVIIGFVWNLILNPLWGVSKTLLDLLHLGFLFKPWLGNASTALTTISFISIWQFIGIPMILFYAALIAIPEEVLEAAYVDGASAWQVFWSIKFPLILPQVGIVSILTFVGNFNAFDLIYAMKGANAGPDFSTDIMGTFFYRTFFGQQLQLGDVSMGSTVAAMMFLIILTGVLLYTVFWQRRIQQIQM